jgi:hypothetical protein
VPFWPVGSPATGVPGGTGVAGVSMAGWADIKSAALVDDTPSVTTWFADPEACKQNPEEVNRDLVASKDAGTQRPGIRIPGLRLQQCNPARDISFAVLGVDNVKAYHLSKQKFAPVVMERMERVMEGIKKFKRLGRETDDAGGVGGECELPK